MGIPVQHSWSSHTWLLSHVNMTAFLATLLAALEELTFGKKCSVLLAPCPKKSIMASSLIKERISLQKVVQTEVPEIVTGKTLICRC